MRNYLRAPLLFDNAFYENFRTAENARVDKGNERMNETAEFFGYPWKSVRHFLFSKISVQ